MATVAKITTRLTGVTGTPGYSVHYFLVAAPLATVA